MHLNAGIMGAMSIIPIGNRHGLYNLFKKLNRFLKENNTQGYELISDKLFRKYVDHDDSKKINSIFSDINGVFLLSLSEKEKITFLKLASSFLRLSEQLDFLKSKGESGDCIKIIISDMPYAIYDKHKKKDFYDNLSGNDEPYWMRTALDESLS